MSKKAKLPQPRKFKHHDVEKAWAEARMKLDKLAEMLDRCTACGSPEISLNKVGRELMVCDHCLCEVIRDLLPAKIPPDVQAAVNLLNGKV